MHWQSQIPSDAAGRKSDDNYSRWRTGNLKEQHEMIWSRGLGGEKSPNPWKVQNETLSDLENLFGARFKV
jgi:hypothetical protein